MLLMTKSPPFERKRRWWRADGSLWANEMIIRVSQVWWAATVALVLGLIIDFLLC